MVDLSDVVGEVSEALKRVWTTEVTEDTDGFPERSELDVHVTHVDRTNEMT